MLTPWLSPHFLILPHINYCILACGYDLKPIYKLQNKVIHGSGNFVQGYPYVTQDSLVYFTTLHIMQGFRDSEQNLSCVTLFIIRPKALAIMQGLGIVSNIKTTWLAIGHFGFYILQNCVVLVCRRTILFYATVLPIMQDFQDNERKILKITVSRPI